MFLDALLDLHAKLSTVVRYYDRMLEERFSNAYSQYSLGYGHVPEGPQYPGFYTPMAVPTPNVKDGAENFYYGNSIAENQNPYVPYYPQYQLERGGVPTGPSGMADAAGMGVASPAPSMPPAIDSASEAAGSGSPAPQLPLQFAGAPKYMGAGNPMPPQPSGGPPGIVGAGFGSGSPTPQFPSAGAADTMGAGSPLPPFQAAPSYGYMGAPNPMPSAPPTGTSGMVNSGCPGLSSQTAAPYQRQPQQPLVEESLIEL